MNDKRGAGGLKDVVVPVASRMPFSRTFTLSANSRDPPQPASHFECEKSVVVSPLDLADDSVFRMELNSSDTA